MAHDPFPAESRRERETRRRSQRHFRARVIAIGVVALAATAAGALVATDTIRFGATGPRLARGAESDNPFLAEAQTVPGVEALSELEPPRRLSHDEPLRLWVGGDSLAGELGPELGVLMGAMGVVDTQVDYKVSSGIASNGVRNWPERAAEQLFEHDPEAIVFIIGANDTVIVNQHRNAFGVLEWEPEYRSAVAEMMDLFVGGDRHRTVFWLGPPTLRDEMRDRGAVELSRVMKEEADKRPDVVYVDTYTLFAGEDGGYASDLPGPDGDPVRVRNSDGVHFTSTGAQRLAAAVFALLDARWEIRAQSDPDQPITYETSPGSGGGSRTAGGSGTGNLTSTTGDEAAATTTVAAGSTTTAGASTTTSAATTTTAAASTTAPAATTTAAPTTSAPAATTSPPPTTSPSPTTGAP